VLERLAGYFLNSPPGDDLPRWCAAGGDSFDCASVGGFVRGGRLDAETEVVRAWPDEGADDDADALLPLCLAAADTPDA
jgi:hypothetical protein